MILTLLVFLIILSLLVLIHELGHFLVAKKLGIKVEEFGFGFPPRLFGIKHGETLYSINLLPIGGFVKLYGEDEAGGGSIKIQDSRIKIQDKDRAFFAKTPWQRATVVIAGVVMNFILASIIFYVYLGMQNFTTEIPLIGSHTFFGVNHQKVEQIIVDGVSKNSPAEQAGMQLFSEITSLNGKKITSSSEFLDTINTSKGKAITVSWKDLTTQKTYSKTLTPRINPPKNQGAIGVKFYLAETVRLTYKTFTQKLFSGMVHPINLMFYNFSIMKTLIAAAIAQHSSTPLNGAVSGPVGIYSVVGKIMELPIKERILQILNLAGLLSISLAFFNVLPIPALDGGRLFFILFEGVTGKKVPENIEGRIHSIGMMVLMAFLVFITFQDISHLLK